MLGLLMILVVVLGVLVLAMVVAVLLPVPVPASTCAVQVGVKSSGQENTEWVQSEGLVAVCAGRSAGIWELPYMRIAVCCGGALHGRE